jgi:hypothetical protein
MNPYQMMRLQIRRIIYRWKRWRDKLPPPHIY